MADTKISQLPAATTPLAGAELVPLVQSGATVQTPTNELSKLTAATANTFIVKQVIEVTDNTNAALRITQLGTADALRVEDSTNPDSTPFIIDASGNVGIGGTPNTKLDILGSVDQSLRLRNTTAASEYYDISRDSVDGFLKLNGAQSSPFVGYKFFTTNTERMRIDASGNVLVTSSGGLGYGTGSGGTVTQATSKSTGVTLNKTNGQITMNAAALAANATVAFVATNSTCANTDVVIVNVSGGVTGAEKYNVWALPNAGTINFYVRNISSGSLSEAVVLNFAVIKAATS